VTYHLPPQYRKPPMTHPTFDAAIAEFGVTTHLGEAGYILPDGQLLDFSAKRDGGPPGRRTLDHRAVSRVTEGDWTHGMNEFIALGAIRFGFMQNFMYFTYELEPTKAQLAHLREAVGFLRGTGALLVDRIRNGEPITRYDSRTPWWIDIETSILKTLPDPQ
jgi:hypothetical protein